MAFTTRLANVRNHRKHFKERTWMCYHQVPPLVRVCGARGGCPASKVPPRTQPFIASENLSCHTSTKTERPCTRPECLDIAISADGHIATLTPVVPALPGAQEIDLAGRLVTPGLIDAHQHLD